MKKGAIMLPFSNENNFLNIIQQNLECLIWNLSRRQINRRRIPGRTIQILPDNTSERQWGEIHSEAECSQDE